MQNTWLTNRLKKKNSTMDDGRSLGITKKDYPLHVVLLVPFGVHDVIIITNVSCANARKPVRMGINLRPPTSLETIFQNILQYFPLCGSHSGRLFLGLADFRKKWFCANVPACF